MYMLFQVPWETKKYFFLHSVIVKFVFPKKLVQIVFILKSHMRQRGRNRVIHSTNALLSRTQQSHMRGTASSSSRSPAARLLLSSPGCCFISYLLLEEGTRLLSAYHLKDGTKIWIIHTGHFGSSQGMWESNSSRQFRERVEIIIELFEIRDVAGDSVYEFLLKCIELALFTCGQNISHLRRKRSEYWIHAL